MADRAAILAPPPVLTALCAGFAWLGHHLRPVPMLSTGLGVRVAGSVALFVAFASLCFAAVREQGRHHTSPNPYQATAALVTSGIYRRTRNPIYLGFVLFLVGFTVALDSPWFLLAALVLATLLHFGVVKPEERYLARKFGAPYEEYRKRVRRWV